MMRSKRQRNRFQPQMDTLEDRCTPAVTLTQTGDTLNITGDAAADAVAVTALSNNVFRVDQPGGIASQTFTGVKTITANLGDGANAISLNLQQSANVSANITTGVDNDTVRVRLGGTLRKNDTLNLTVDTGAGSDSAGIVATTPALAAGNPAGDVYYTYKSQNTINATINLGDGDDAALFYLAQIGRYDNDNITVDGGSGFNFYTLASGAIGQNARLTYNVTGGTGGDFLTTYLGALDANSHVNMTDNLGDGDNQANLAVTWLNQNAELNETVNTGSGADIVRTRIGETTNPASEGQKWIWANANVNINVNLGGGDDIALIQIVGSVDKNANVTTNVDGGTGTDNAVFFYLVSRGQIRGRVSNVELIQGGGPGRK